MQNKFLKMAIFSLSLGIIYLHSLYTFPWLIKSRQWYKGILINPTKEFIVPGAEFSDLKPYLQNIHNVGFLSDQHIHTQNANISQFLAAQYSLIPTRIHLNDPDHEWIILDVNTKSAAEKMTKKLNAELVYGNPHQKFLIKRKK